jgi:hypothetical protein
MEEPNQIKPVPVWQRYLPLGLSLLYAVVLVLVAPFHGVFSEWSGVAEWFSGKELVSGAGYHGWSSDFYPPLYPLLMGVVGLTTNGFLAGKIISIACASLLLWVAYFLAGELCPIPNAGFWTQVFVALSPLLVQEALQADNHMLEALLFNCGLLLFLRFSKLPRPGPLFLAGTVCALAGLTRYTSYVLALLPVSFWVLGKVGRRLTCTAAFWTGFVLVSAPWWIYNARYHGSPLYNLNYLNVWTGIIGRDTNSLQVLWRSLGVLGNGGMGEIIRHHSAAYARNVLSNLFRSIDVLIESAGVLALLIVPGFLEWVLTLKPSKSIPVCAVLAASMFAVSQAYVNSYYLMQWIVVAVVVAVAFLLNYLQRAAERFPGVTRWRLRPIALGFLLIYGTVLWTRPLKTYRREAFTYHALLESSEVTRALKEYDPGLQSKVVMALDPARAYYAGSKYLETPFEYVGPVEGLVSYQGVSPRLRKYAAKFPSNMDEGNLRADYLVYTRPPDNLQDLHDPVQFAFLMDPASPEVPKNFKPVYRSSNVVVYQILGREH